MPKHHRASPKPASAKTPTTKGRCTRPGLVSYPSRLTAILDQPVLPAPGMPVSEPRQCPAGCWHVS